MDIPGWAMTGGAIEPTGTPNHYDQDEKLGSGKKLYIQWLSGLRWFSELHWFSVRVEGLNPTFTLCVELVCSPCIMQN